MWKTVPRSSGMRRSGTTSSPSINGPPFLEGDDELATCLSEPLQLRAHLDGEVPNQDGEHVGGMPTEVLRRHHRYAGPGDDPPLLGRVPVDDIVDCVVVDTGEVEQDGGLGSGAIAGERAARAFDPAELAGHLVPLSQGPCSVR